MQQYIYIADWYLNAISTIFSRPDFGKDNIDVPLKE
jgi:hypothetical protein